MLSFQTDVSHQRLQVESGESFKGQRKVGKNKNAQKRKSFASLLAFLLARGLALALPSASNSEFWGSLFTSWQASWIRENTGWIYLQQEYSILNTKGDTGDRICRTYNIQPGSWKIPTRCILSPGMLPSCSSWASRTTQQKIQSAAGSKKNYV